MFKLSRSMFSRSRIAVITLAVLSIAWILVNQFLFRGARCANIMCPANDYEYLFRITLVIVISAAAFWLLKPQTKDK